MKKILLEHRKMIKKINIKNLIIFIILLAIEISIALFIHDDFIRPFIWDLLVVILIYYFIRIFYQKHSTKLIIWIFIFWVFIEFLQYLNLIEILNIQNKILKVIIGSVFDWKDILAYGVGCGILIFKEKLWKK